MRAFEVLRARGRRSRLDVAAERGLTPLVGRDAGAGDAARAASARSRPGGARSSSWQARPGSASRACLSSSVARWRRPAKSVTWLEGQCVSFGQNDPLPALVDQLRRELRHRGVRRRARDHRQGRARHAADGASSSRTSRSSAISWRSIPAIRSVAAMDARGRAGEALRGGPGPVAAGGRLRPIVFVFEDLHWIDASSEEYLGSAHRLRGRACRSCWSSRTGSGYTPPFGTRSFQTTLTLRTPVRARDAGHGRRGCSARTSSRAS